MDPVLFCWVLTIDRPVSEEEYSQCVRVIQTVFPDSSLAARLSVAPTSHGMLREMATALLPVLMMRKQGVSRSQWRQRETERGKTWIERNPGGVHPDVYAASMIGHATSAAHNVIVMAAAKGTRARVVTLGVSAKLCAIHPPTATVQQWAQSQAHKLTALERSLLADLPDDTLVRRLFIVLALKDALLDALGERIGFDLSRIECDVPSDALRLDGHAVRGWELTLFRAHQQGAAVNELYQVAVAVQRGDVPSRFVFLEQHAEVERLTYSFSLDKLLEALPKLLQ